VNRKVNIFKNLFLVGLVIIKYIKIATIEVIIVSPRRHETRDRREQNINVSTLELWGFFEVTRFNSKRQIAIMLIPMTTSRDKYNELRALGNDKRSKVENNSNALGIFNLYAQIRNKV
jgi:hypothetical protein